MNLLPEDSTALRTLPWKRAIGSLAVKALPAIYGAGLVLFVMRVVPLGDFGRYGLAIAYVNLVAGISRGLWLAPLVQRAALGRQSEVTGPVLGLEMITAVVGGLGALAILPLLHTGWVVALLAALMLPILVPRDISFGMAQAQGKIHLAFWIEAGYFIGALSGFAVLASLGLLTNAEAVMLVNVVAALVSAVIAIAFYPMAIRFRTQGDWTGVIDSAKWLGTLTVSDIGLQQSDTLLAGAFHSPAQIAPYIAARTLLKLYSLFSQSINFILFPVASRLAAAGMYRHLKRRMRTALAVLMGGLLPANLIVFMFCDKLFPMVLGEQYVAAVPFFRVLIFVTFLEPVYSVVANSMIAVGKAKSVAPLLAAGLICNVGLNLVLLPTVGVWGAAISLVVSYLVLAAGTYLLIKREFVSDSLAVVTD